MQLTQKELKPLSGDLEEKNVLTEGLRKAAKARKGGGGGQVRELREGTKRRRYNIYVQECFYGFAWVL